MERLVIDGGRRLSGEVAVSGAKNSILPLLASSLLTKEPCVFHQIPWIRDVDVMLEIMAHLGCKIEVDRDQRTVCVESSQLDSTDLPPSLASQMRASFLLVGPLLARMGEVRAPHPRGCAIGRRPVNVDIKAYTSMGSTASFVDGLFHLQTTGLWGKRMYLDYPSHTGTENVMMAACLSHGDSYIVNASAEPEVVDLANCLRTMGARIAGDGSSVIYIEGVGTLRGADYTVMPDRIEAGTYALAAAITGGEVTLSKVNSSHMEPLTHKLIDAGAIVEESEGAYHVARSGQLKSVELQTLHFPGFPSDLQAGFTTMLTQANGVSTVHERVFDDRLQYVNELRKLGAKIKIEGQTATVYGPSPLAGAEIRALDIRSGAASVLAGLVADGTTVIDDIHHLDRGYVNIHENLSNLGANIRRVAD